MRSAAQRQEQALKLIDKLVRISPDQGAILHAIQIRERLLLPISAVLERVPGSNIVQKAKACGVSRQAFYSWRRGVSRPNAKQSERLAELTGYKAEDIRGTVKLSRQSVAQVEAAAARRVSRPKRARATA